MIVFERNFQLIDLTLSLVAAMPLRKFRDQSELCSLFMSTSRDVLYFSFVVRVVDLGPGHGDLHVKLATICLVLGYTLISAPLK
jgi:hypothetical protein